MTKNTPRTSITAILSGKLTLPLGPENISTIPLYQIHHNLWGRLIDEKGNPWLAHLAGVSKEGKLFQFEMEPEARFSNGRKITPEDVLFSFQRLMNKQEPGHFSAKSLIKVIRISSPSRFDIELNDKTAAFSFLLSTPEMGIVPKESCDANGNLIHLDVTSGAYSLEGEPQADRLVLRKNPFSKSAVQNSPEHVEVLFRSGTDELIHTFDETHADFVEVYSKISAQTLENLKGRSDLDVLMTRPSYSVFITTNPKHLTRQERESLAKLLREKLSYPFTAGIERPSLQLLPPGTFGSIPENALPKLDPTPFKLPSKVKIASYDKTGPLLDAVVATLRASGVPVEVIPMNSPDYDLTFSGQGMNLDFPEIEFHLNMVSQWALISANSEEKDLIMNTIHSSNPADRTSNIQKLGRQVLDDARVIPLVVRSYVHISRRTTLQEDQSSGYDGDTPFWKMQVKTP